MSHMGYCFPSSGHLRGMSKMLLHMFIHIHTHSHTCPCTHICTFTPLHTHIPLHTHLQQARGPSEEAPLCPAWPIPHPSRGALASKAHRLVLPVPELCVRSMGSCVPGWLLALNNILPVIFTCVVCLAVIYSFLSPSNIPRCECTTIYLSIVQPMDIRVVSTHEL